MNKPQTDTAKIAEEFNVTQNAVTKALNRRAKYPNNKLVKAYDAIQAAKDEALKNLANSEA